MSAGKCVICSKPKDPRFKPFCSKRCADVDLQRWFSGRYAIAAAEEGDPDTAREETPPGQDRSS